MNMDEILKEALRTEDDIKDDEELKNFLEKSGMSIQEFDLYCLMKYFNDEED